jgi:hypothetical protein
LVGAELPATQYLHASQDVSSTEDETTAQ